MATLKDRRAKAESKVARTAKALEIAKKELSDLVAAERVMAEITGESVEPKGAAAAPSDRDREITKLLSDEHSQAISPVDLHSVYTENTGDIINLDAFRTALWRLQKRVVRDGGRDWTVRSDNGRYWREAMPDANDSFDEMLG